ncbi:MAG: rod shape-determining protein MreC, partial [Acidimicrobiales bacterium]
MPRRSSRPRFTVMVLALLALTLVTVDARASGGGTLAQVRGRMHDAFAPLQRATHAALRPLGDFLSGSVHYGAVKTENQRLREQLAAAQEKTLQADFQAEQAREVLAQAHLSFVGDIPTVTGQVIDQGATNFEDSVTLDKGATSGVAPGQPVVAAGGLVGEVAQVSARTSTVVLVTDPTFVVGVMVDGNPQNAASAQGYGRGRPVRV